jgi:hypothetical protein
MGGSDSEYEMKRTARLTIILCVLLATAGAALVAYRWVDGVFRVRMTDNYEFKRMHTSRGEVISISPMQAEQQAKGGAPGPPHYKICFSIDSFSDIPLDLQAEYAAAESARNIKEGPQCITSRNASLPASLKPGDTLEVDYLLYGRGIITVERLVASGQDIDAS